MISHLVDTDVCVEALRRRNPRVADLFKGHGNPLAVSAVTVTELHYAAARSRDPERNAEGVREFLGFLEVLALDEADGESAGEVRAELAAAGTPIGGYDALIAGQARRRGLTVATGNVAEFDRVTGLRVEDWSGR